MNINPKKLLIAVLAPIGKGLLVFGILGFGLYVYGAMFPVEQPNPVTGVLGRFVGFSEKTYQEYTLGSYMAANQAPCGVYGEGAHVCTSEEMLHNYSFPTTELLNASGEALVNGGPPGFTAPARDCDAWSSESNKAYGRFWSFNENFGRITNCSSAGVLPFACCV